MRLRLLVLFVAAVLFTGVGTTTASAVRCTYDLPTGARVDVQEIVAAGAAPAELSVAQERSALPAVEARGMSTTPVAGSVATEAGPAFYRGAKPGEAPSFEPPPERLQG